MNKIGLVLAGGGAKGSYQIGVFKALDEYNIKPKFVSGTSIGAFNGLFYAQNDFELAKKVWDNLEDMKLINSNFEKFQKEIELMSTILALSLRLHKLPISFTDKSIISQIEVLKIIDNFFDINKIINSDIDLYVCSHNITKKIYEIFDIKKYDEETIKKILLATSAIPFAFDKVIINEDVYIDGGWSLNCPIEPLYEIGCNVIIVVCLDNDYKIDLDKYKGSKIIPIYPSKDLGGMFNGIFDFSNKGSKWRMELGYNDSKKILKYFYSIINNDKMYYKMWEDININLKKQNQFKEIFEKTNKNIIEKYFDEEFAITSEFENEISNQFIENNMGEGLNQSEKDDALNNLNKILNILNRRNQNEL